MGYALRHINDLSAAFREFHRALKPGGRLLLLEITKPTGRFALWGLKTYMRLGVPLIARVVARRKLTPTMWRYYWDTIEACVPPETVLEALRAAGFVDVERYVELGIFSEYRARRP
jgi:demethylmenaquinone methyltransferase/2-methoxy-6-polyprenyl-1,4-benzoquinol methylase